MSSSGVEKCLLCGRPTHSRGLCNTHYAWAAKDVKAGRRTWQELESQGGARPLGAGWKNAAMRAMFRQAMRRGSQ